MARTPYDVLAERIARKSDLRLQQVKVDSVQTGTVTVVMRGATVAGVPYTGTAPSANDLMWVLVDGGTIVGLT